MSLNERIREQRKACGMSQEKVAELMGVSRQAVTKWETGESAPSTENLFKLAGVFGTTVDILMADPAQGDSSNAEQIYRLYQQDEVRKKVEKHARHRKNGLTALAVVGGYLIIYLLVRVLAFGFDPSYNMIAWLIGMELEHLPYLYGWLLQTGLFWAAMLISAIPALFGKYRFSSTTLTLFGVGLLLGELCGKNPAGAAWGYGHYGWLVWCLIFLLGIIMGIILERLSGREVLTLRSRRLWIWCGIVAVGIAAIVLLARLSMPTDFTGW